MSNIYALRAKRSVITSGTYEVAAETRALRTATLTHRECPCGGRIPCDVTIRRDVDRRPESLVRYIPLLFVYNMKESD